VFFNIKILRVNNDKGEKDFLMIEQKNSNFGDQRLMFFVFPLIINSQHNKKKIKKHKHQNANPTIKQINSPKTDHTRRNYK